MNQSRIKNNKQNYPIVMLPGWRVTGDRYEAIQKLFENKGYTVLAPTLPGSGTVPLTKSIMSVDDYVDVVLTQLQKNKCKKAILVGHSFGGRIAAKLTALHPELVDKLILTGAPLIKQPLSLKKQFVIAVATPFKKLKDVPVLRKYFYVLLGEMDYLNVPENIKATFRKIIAEDLAEYLPKISVPTLILWGGNDTFVGIHLGKKIAAKIPGAVYKEVPEASHKLPYEYPKEFAKIVLEFIS